MGKAKASAAEAKAEKLQEEVDGHVRAAVLKAATADGPLKLQPTEGGNGRVCSPMGRRMPIKDAIARATAGEQALFRSAGIHARG